MESETEWKALKDAFNENLRKYQGAYGNHAEAPCFLERQESAKKWRSLEIKTNRGSIWQNS